MKLICSLTLYLAILSTGLSQDVFTVSVDFGGAASGFPWNNVDNSQSGSIPDLIDQQGEATGISLSITDAFNGTNSSGTTTPDMALDIPATASGDSFFGNTEEFSSRIEESGGVTLSGLDPDVLYSIEIFASRIATDNRETFYNIEGLNSDFAELNVSSNESEIIVHTDLSPSADGTLSITAAKGVNNNNAFGFFYLGAIRLSYEGERLILDSLLVLTDPLGAEYWQTGKGPNITWKSQSIGLALLEYSLDGGANWIRIDEVPARAQSYTWTVPDVRSDDCLIRITGGGLSDQSQTHFVITNADTSSCHIVVLGSSTAAGAGPTSRDSAWVWLYENFIFQRDTRFDVTNLARGGFTTYNILPDESIIPDNLSFTIDTTRNITRALSLNPNAIIINLPSNDAANSISVDDQILNYQNILTEVEALEIPFWICTPQPRNGFSESQQMIQNEMLDSTETIYADNFIDFWSELATDTDRLDELFNSGDGVHLNNAGHRILLQRVLDIGIDSVLLNSKAPPSLTHDPSLKRLRLYPNPTSDYVILKDLNGLYYYELFDAAGQLIQSGNSSENKIHLEQSGVQYLLVDNGKELYLSRIFKK